MGVTALGWEHLTSTPSFIYKTQQKERAILSDSIKANTRIKENVFNRELNETKNLTHQLLGENK
jgi:hypothetical protein